MRENYNWKSFVGSFEMEINYSLIIAYISKTLLATLTRSLLNLNFLALPFAILLRIKHLFGGILH
jgi:hypothetical protein